MFVNWTFLQQTKIERVKSVRPWLDSTVQKHNHLLAKYLYKYSMNIVLSQWEPGPAQPVLWC